MKPTIVALLALVAVFTAGCGRNESPALPERATATTSPPPAAPAPKRGDRNHPIPLQQAIAEGLCELEKVNRLGADSRYINFVLTPKVDTEPWIQVEAGWKLVARKGQGAAVTVLPGVGQLFPTAPAMILAPVADIAASSSMSTTYDWARLAGDDPLTPLIAAAQAQPPPSWNALQTAVFVLARDIGYQAMRLERFSASEHLPNAVILGGAGGPVALHAGVIDEAAALLQRAGQAPARFKLFREMDEAYAKVLADWKAAGRADLQALDLLGFFRTRPVAFSILASVWTTRPAEKKSYRETAMRHLSSALVDQSRRPFQVDAKVRAAFEVALAQETDPSLRQQIERELERAAQAEKP